MNMKPLSSPASGAAARAPRSRLLLRVWLRRREGAATELDGDSDEDGDTDSDGEPPDAEPRRSPREAGVAAREAGAE